MVRGLGRQRRGLTDRGAGPILVSTRAIGESNPSVHLGHGVRCAHASGPERSNTGEASRRRGGSRDGEGIRGGWEPLFLLTDVEQHTVPTTCSEAYGSLTCRESAYTVSRCKTQGLAENTGLSVHQCTRNLFKNFTQSAGAGSHCVGYRDKTPVMASCVSPSLEPIDETVSGLAFLTGEQSLRSYCIEQGAKWAFCGRNPELLA